jgi:hypothetical protein
MHLNFQPPGSTKTVFEDWVSGHCCSKILGLGGLRSCRSSRRSYRGASSIGHQIIFDDVLLFVSLVFFLIDGYNRRWPSFWPGKLNSLFLTQLDQCFFAPAKDDDRFYVTLV